jgi:hypothetical protein|uniref:Uncharacterized protein n=1 Tax=viral metagenome TaxID=1070528 RepID=A0A6C0IU30_9ZZZZ
MSKIQAILYIDNGDMGYNRDTLQFIKSHIKMIFRKFDLTIVPIQASRLSRRQAQILHDHEFLFPSLVLPFARLVGKDDICHFFQNPASFGVDVGTHHKKVGKKAKSDIEGFETPARKSDLYETMLQNIALEGQTADDTHDVSGAPSTDELMRAAEEEMTKHTIGGDPKPPSKGLSSLRRGAQDIEKAGGVLPITVEKKDIHTLMAEQIRHGGECTVPVR